MSVDRVEVLAEHSVPSTLDDGQVGFGHLAITRQVFSFVEQHFSGVERKKPVEKGWPQTEFETDGLVVALNPEWIGGHPHEGSVKAFEHLLLSAAPALVACDPYDLDASSTRSHVYIYDTFGGGIRLSEPIHDRFSELVELANEIVSTCPCEDGCPSCVFLARRPDGNRELSKAGAQAILAALADAVTIRRTDRSCAGEPP